jgi:hypothetical protein
MAQRSLEGEILKQLQGGFLFPPVDLQQMDCRLPVSWLIRGRKLQFESSLDLQSPDFNHEYIS